MFYMFGMENEYLYLKHSGYFFAAQTIFAWGRSAQKYFEKTTKKQQVSLFVDSWHKVKSKAEALTLSFAHLMRNKQSLL